MHCKSPAPLPTAPPIRGVQTASHSPLHSLNARKITF